MRSGKKLKFTIEFIAAQVEQEEKRLKQRGEINPGFKLRASKKLLDILKRFEEKGKLN